MRIEIIYTDYFYKEGEQYDVSENTRWGCFMVEGDKSLIRISHAVVIPFCKLQHLKNLKGNRVVVKEYNDGQTFYELAARGVQFKENIPDLPSEYHALRKLNKKR